jgi:maltose O-acetyltransferase
MPTDHFAQDPRTNLERMLAGDLYIADDPEIARRQQRAVQLAARYQTAYTEDAAAAQPILAELLGSLGTEAHVRPPLYVDYGSNITIGARTFVNYNLTALDVAAITIGEDCQIGPNVQLLTPTHPLEAEPRRDKLEAARPITIGDNVWLGGLQRRRHRPARRDHRRQLRHRRRGGRHQGRARGCRRRGQPGPAGAERVSLLPWQPDTPTRSGASGSSTPPST